MGLGQNILTALDMVADSQIRYTAGFSLAFTLGLSCDQFINPILPSAMSHHAGPPDNGGLSISPLFATPAVWRLSGGEV